MLSGDQAAASFRDCFVKPENPKSGQNEAGLCQDVWNPRRFEDKYKELNPGKYAEDVEHVIVRGRTPAGMHIPICVKEIL